MLAALVRLSAILCCVSAAGQEPWSSVYMGQFVLQGAISPLNDVTNISVNGTNATVLSFYLPSSANYTTNAGKTVVLSDLWTNRFNLTNSQSGLSAKWPVRQPGALNSYDTLLFNVANGTYLCSATCTTTPPLEIVMVMRWDGPTNGTTSLVCDGNTTLGRAFGGQGTHGLFTRLLSSSDAFAFDSNTNKWMVWDLVFSSGNGYIYTNNVQAYTAALTPNAVDGITIGAAYNKTAFFSPIDVACLVVYGSTNDQSVVPSILPGTNSVARTAVYAALTNHFNLAP